MAAQGHPRTIFRRAIEHGNLTVAEATVREIGAVSLEEALALTVLVAQKEPHRRSAFAIRWLRRLIDEDRHLTIDQAALAASALASLGGRSHAEAHATLASMAERASRRTRPTQRPQHH
jgi:hypothetical protein